MTYKEFLNRIDEFVNCVVEFTVVLKATGETHKSQRVVWDNNDFKELKSDSLIDVLNVEFVRAR